MINEKYIKEFLELLTGLTPIEFIGFCKVMSIPVIDEEKNPIPAEKLIESLLTKFYNSNRQKRKRILKVLQIGGGASFGTNAKLPKENSQ